MYESNSRIFSSNELLYNNTRFYRFKVGIIINSLARCYYLFYILKNIFHIHIHKRLENSCKTFLSPIFSYIITSNDNFFSKILLKLR